MSFYANQFMATSRPLDDAPPVPKRSRWFDANLIDLVRPESGWPYPFSLERAFELFRWMARTGADYSTRDRWGTVSVADLLSATSGIGHASPKPVLGLEDLKQRFHYAVLGRAMSESQARWRKDFGIGPTGKVRIVTPTYRPFEGAVHLGWKSEECIVKDYRRLSTGEAGATMAVSLNSYHDDCRVLHGMRVEVGTKGFWFALRYGDKQPKDFGSSWDESVACTRDGESFLDTFARARDVYDCLVHGKANGCDTGDLDRYGRPGHVHQQIEAIHAGSRPAAA